MGQIAPLAIGAAALQTGSGVLKAAGESRAIAFKAGEAAKAARAGKIAAAETDTALRQELTDVIANIRAVRASSGISPDSPTTQAIIASEEKASERQRRIQVGNIERQAASDASASKFLRKSAGQAFLFGSFNAATRGFTSLAGR